MKSVPQADYHEIAKTFDDGRSLNDSMKETWFNLITEFGWTQSGNSLLDLGCGTGRFSIPFALELGLDVTGGDRSEEMIKQAETKAGAGHVTWLVEDAAQLAHRTDTFDNVFMSHVLHHVPSASAVIAESYRVLAPGGAILVRYATMEQIANDIEHLFFKGATEIDRKRMLSRATTEKLLIAAGFQGVVSEETVQESYTSAEEHVDRAAAKCTSVLHLIEQLDPLSFTQGLADLRAYAATNPDDERLVKDQLTLTVGYKPA